MHGSGVLNNANWKDRRKWRFVVIKYEQVLRTARFFDVIHIHAQAHAYTRLPKSISISMRERIEKNPVDRLI